MKPFMCKIRSMSSTYTKGTQHLQGNVIQNGSPMSDSASVPRCLRSEEFLCGPLTNRQVRIKQYSFSHLDKQCLPSKLWLKTLKVNLLAFHSPVALLYHKFRRIFFCMVPVKSELIVFKSPGRWLNKF